MKENSQNYGESKTPHVPGRRIPQIGVIGSSETNDGTLQMAEQVGALIARLGATLVSGGRNAGIMTAASKGCAEAGGIVIGIVPSANFTEGNEYCHYVIPTGMGWTRNTLTGIAGDVMVVIGGSAGTLSEITYAWMFNRPILALSCTGGWAEKLAGQALDNRREDVIVDCRTLEDLERALREHLGRLGFRGCSDR